MGGGEWGKEEGEGVGGARLVELLAKKCLVP